MFALLVLFLTGWNVEAAQGGNIEANVLLDVTQEANVYEEMDKFEDVNEEFFTQARAYLENADIEEETINSLIDIASLTGSLPRLVEVLPKALAEGFSNFNENWNYVIEDIYALNPDVTLMVLGMSDNGVKGKYFDYEGVVGEPVGGASAGDDSAVVSGAIVGLIMEVANKPMIDGTKKFGYTYVDTAGTTYVDSHPDADGNTIEYNAAFLTRTVDEKMQVIEYDVGFNQTIQVNSTADECFLHGIGREVNDLVNAMQEVVDMEKIIKELEAAKESASGTAATALQEKLDIANKALDYMKDKTQKLYEAGIATFQGYLDKANLAVTSCGTRSSKLSLIETRMQTQKTTFETLKSENEDADITEVAIKLSSAELTYEAALMATGKIMQTTLLNFI